jgi:hypothetical protein
MLTMLRYLLNAFFEVHRNLSSIAVKMFSREFTLLKKIVIFILIVRFTKIML